mgnify:FL=1
MKYKAIFVDIDDTLLDYIPCCRQSFDEALQLIQMDHVEDKDRLFDLFMEISNRLFSEAKRGIYTVAQVMDLYPAEFIERAGWPQHLLEPFTQGFRQGWGNSHALVEGAFEMLQTLHQRGYKLYAASNSFGHLQRMRLHLAGVLPFFEGTYISMDIGYDKPDRRFYDFALNDAQLSADEVLMVGDSMTTDIIGAQRVGIDTCWFNPTNRPIGTTQPTYEIHDLLSLLTVLP